VLPYYNSAVCAFGYTISWNCGPQDAFRCFMGNELDLLVVGRCMMHKGEQDIRLKQDYSSAFELD